MEPKYKYKKWKKYPFKGNEGYVYAVRCGNKIKIGKSRDVKTRFRLYEITSDIFYPLTIVFSSNYHVTEKEILNYFGGRVQNEWFDWSESFEIEVMNHFEERAYA